MTSSKIIEVMARAMCVADGFVWEKQFSHMTSANGDDSPESYLHAAEAALTAYESHLQASGMAVVPVEPTDEMIVAGSREIMSESPQTDAREAWAAMLAASPNIKAPDREG